MRFYPWKTVCVAAPCMELARFFSASALRFDPSNDDLDGKNRNKATMHYGIDSDKLKLKLNFEKMNFDKIAEATREAQQREKSKVYVKSEEEEEEKGNVENAAGTSKEPSNESAADLKSETRNSFRGIECIGDIVVEGTPASVHAHRYRESRGAARYTLADTLRDCSLSGNATKALLLFDGALEKACHSVLLPACKGAVDRIPENEDEAKQLLKEKESDCFDMLRRLVAALPPPYNPDASTETTRQPPYRGNPKKHLSGLLRWNGRHFYLLLKTLFEADRLDDAARVWDILTRLGYIEYHLDGKMTNNLIALARRSGEDVQLQRLRNPLSESQGAKKTEEVLDREKAFRRRVIVELEAAAKKKHIALSSKNVKTVQTARIAQALSNSDTVAESGLSSSDVEGDALRVGDFNGLLRGARSHQATRRILGMMEKLQIEKTADVYAAIVASLHHPEYLVEGADPSEVIAAGHSAASREVDTDETTSALSGDTKSSYEAYKEKRIAEAKKWYDQCEASQRNAELYNHYLYMLRSPKHESAFNEVLNAFRGNTIRTVAEAEAVHQYLKRQEHEQLQPPVKSAAAQEKAAGFVPAIQAPQWTCRPNGKTYEMLILRCRYQHDWPAMWALLEEMQSQKVRGTQRLYNILIGEAKQHPPTVFKGLRVQDPARVIMGLYGRMREDRLDVNSLDNTVNLVNAWTSVRNKRNWS